MGAIIAAALTLANTLLGLLIGKKPVVNQDLAQVRAADAAAKKVKTDAGKDPNDLDAA